VVDAYPVRLPLATATLCVLVAIPPLAAQAPESPLTLDAALARAATFNLAIIAARSRRQADLASIAVAAERLNPEVHVEFEREAPTRAYGFAVPWETAGKRARRIAVGQAALQTGEAEVARTELEVRAGVRRAYFARVIAESRLTLLDDLRSIATRARDAAQQRFDAGSAPRLEVLQAQLALSQAENEALAVRGEATAARAALNALLALPLSAPTPLSPPVDGAAGMSTESALARAATSNGELLVIDKRIQEQRARIALAHALQSPDVTPDFTITRGQPEFSTGWRAAVGISVPVFTTHRAGVQLEEATLAQIERERAAVASRIAGEVTAAVAIAETQRELYLRYRDDILPQAIEVERIAEDAYRLGQTGIAALLQALQATRSARLQSVQAAAALQAALSDLERAMGVPIP
jgi:outer membrane protein, heavy metal efflux system